jgi:predicted component of type VI protein secretion system
MNSVQRNRAIDDALQYVELVKLLMASLDRTLEAYEKRITDLEYRVNKAENRKTLSLKT